MREFLAETTLFEDGHKGYTHERLRSLHGIKQILKKGTSLLFVSHSIEQVEEVCKRMIWLEKGRVVKDEPTEILADEYRNAYQ